MVHEVPSTTRGVAGALAPTLVATLTSEVIGTTGSGTALLTPCFGRFLPLVEEMRFTAAESGGAQATFSRRDPAPSRRWSRRASVPATPQVATISSTLAPDFANRLAVS